MSGDQKNQKNQLIGQKDSSDAAAKTDIKTAETKQTYHEDYEQIQAAVLETKRGRWFLNEFARKNKVVDSQVILDALVKIETKIDGQASAPKIAAAQNTTPEETATAPSKFETAQQSSLFAQLFANFKHKTMQGLEWAGIKGSIEFSKVQTIINFAALQSRISTQNQEKALNKIIDELQSQNVDPKELKKLTRIAGELSKLEELQANLNIQLEDGLKFMGEVEKIAQNLPPDLTKFTPKKLETPPKSVEKTPKNVEKVAKNEQKTPNNSQKTPIIEQKPAEIEQKTTELPPKKIILGPAGRIKKMFRIEQTLKTQMAEDLVVPAKAFDEAFATERLQVEQTQAKQPHVEDNSPPDIILQQADIIEPVQSKIEEQSEKLASIGDMMKQVDAIKNNAPKDINNEPEIIIENDFNALNSLALLSKTERTMLFTLQN